MKKALLIAIMTCSVIIAKAQTTNTAVTEHDAAVKAKDADIKTNIIDPAEQDAGSETPDWKALTQTITQKYDATTADRTITKAKIYYYYNKDWPAFCDAIVHYTDNFELANDYPLLNKNAGMILKNSNDAAQLKEAQKWAKAALDSDPNNEQYKTTYQALSAKINK
ncbi:MAG: hypothetical protein JST19_04345 [Bacteroidetes bacterium]|nr:hypothetical protein [Bacteroidota bacterium]